MAKAKIPKPSAVSSNYPRYHAPGYRSTTSASNHGGSVDFLQQGLNFFNVFFMLAGFGVLGIGLWAILDKQGYASLIVSTTYAVAAYLLIAAGVLVLVAGILGFVGICQLRKGLVIVYLLLLILIFLIEMGAGFLAYFYAEQMHSHLTVRLKDLVANDYGSDPKITSSFDSLQQNIGCCGSEDFREWELSNWGKSPNITGAKLANFVPVPDSCCKNSTAACGRFSHPSNIYYDGCAYAFSNFLRDHLFIIGGVGIGVCAVQLFGAILSCCLCSKLTPKKTSSRDRDIRYSGEPTY